MYKIRLEFMSVYREVESAMRRKLLTFLIVIGGMVGISGCGVAQAQHNELLEQHDELSLNLEETSGLLSATQSYLSLAREAIDELEERNQYLEEKIESLGVHFDLSREEALLEYESLNREGIIAELDELISDKQTELENLRTRVRETGEAPIQLGAGNWYAGTDIPAGRYRASGGSSNFVVRGNSGRLIVNTILGGRNGVADYVFTLPADGIIETRSAVTLTPIE